MHLPIGLTFRTRVIVLVSYVAIIFLSLPFGRAIAKGIRSHGLATKGAFILTGLLVCFFAWRAWPSAKAAPIRGLLTGLALITSTLTLFFTLELPEERLHFFQYGLLGYLLGWTVEALENQPITLGKRLFLGYGVAFFIGTMDEVIQWILPMRVFDLHDIFWNVVSAWLGLWIFQFSRV